MMEGIASFFSPEAGQRRTRWLNGVGGQIGEAARYYLGPTGIPERAGAAASVAGMFSPGADVMDATTASGDLMRARSPMEAATAGAGMVGALGSMFIPGNAQRAGEALTRFGADESGALRLFHGSPRTDLKELLPSPQGTGALGPGVYGTPFSRTADLYTQGAGRVYEFDAPEDLFFGAGARWDDIPSNVSSFQVWRDQVARMADANPAQADLVATAGNRMLYDGYPFFRELAYRLGSKEAAQDLYKNAGFKGLTAMVDGPEVVLFDPVRSIR